MSSDIQPKYYSELLDIWNSSDFQAGDINLDKKYEEQSRIIGEYASLNNQFINIYNLKKQRVLYMSENYVKVLGYDCSIAQYKRWSLFYWMRDLPFTQAYFFLQLSNFYKNTIQPHFKSKEIKSMSWYLHNFQLKPPGQARRHLGLTCTALEIDATGKLEIIMIINHNVEPLIKADSPFWFEMNFNNEIRYSYSSEDKKVVEKSIFSSRELEILDLIQKGNDSKQIADLLNLSSLTVEKHRKNMLDRSGAKDISMLIQILNISGVF
jgi:DNA-binding CsgD family transcriptional regulator